MKFRVGAYFTQHHTANSLKDIETSQGRQGWDLSSATYALIAFNPVPIVQVWRLRPEEGGILLKVTHRWRQRSI